MIAEKNGITVDTRTAAPARKMIKCPQKTGINLNLQEDRQRDRRTLLIGILAIAALVTVVVNFGVLQQYRRLDKAQAAYDRVHTQYVSAQEALSDYDRVLLEYRTYSMDWMTAAGSEDIPAAVDPRSCRSWYGCVKCRCKASARLWTCWSRRCSAMAPSRRSRSPKTP